MTPLNHMTTARRRWRLQVCAQGSIALLAQLALSHTAFAQAAPTGVRVDTVSIALHPAALDDRVARHRRQLLDARLDDLARHRGQSADAAHLLQCQIGRAHV